MAKNKLKRFNDLRSFSNVLEPTLEELNNGFILKGSWGDKIFNNRNPISLELGCGKGEYVINLARKYPNQNFIGIDIKGSRIWVGAKNSLDENLKNAFFLRINIEHIHLCFANDEINNIWITFPDPQIKRRRARKRLTHPNFLVKYNDILRSDSFIFLKTDSKFLYGYTLGIIESFNHKLIDCADDLYNKYSAESDFTIETYYESIFLEKNISINFIKFQLKFR